MASQLRSSVLSTLLAACVAVLVFSGCDSNPGSQGDLESDSVQQQDSKDKKDKLAGTGASSETPKAADFDETPEGVCREFMTLLQAGNRIAAENLLTRASISNITSEGLKLEPIGGPNAKVKMGQVHFATNQKKLAHVECTVSDPGANPQNELKLSWQAKVKKDGRWRISGVILDKEDGSGIDLLSFENPIDVQKIQAMAAATELDQLEGTRQAKREVDIK